jgi:hypothetical protein
METGFKTGFYGACHNAVSRRIWTQIVIGRQHRVH